jgi:hypothetical protein
MTVAGLPGPCRDAAGRFRQKGDADLLQTGKFSPDIAFAVLGVHTRSGLHISNELAGVHNLVIAILRPHLHCGPHSWLLRGVVVRTDLNHFLSQHGQ